MAEITAGEWDQAIVRGVAEAMNQPHQEYRIRTAPGEPWMLARKIDDTNWRIHGLPVVFWGRPHEVEYLADLVIEP
jgi:hypothetical protein